MESDKILIKPIRTEFSQIQNNEIFIHPDMLKVECSVTETWSGNPQHDKCEELFRLLAERFTEYVHPIKNDPLKIQTS